MTANDGRLDRAREVIAASAAPDPAIEAEVDQIDALVMDVLDAVLASILHHREGRDVEGAAALGDAVQMLNYITARQVTAVAMHIALIANHQMLAERDAAGEPLTYDNAPKRSHLWLHSH